MAKIDKIDKHIIFELDRDARQTPKEIGKKVGMSRDAVAYRIKQLEKQGYIEGYYTLIDPSKLGYMLIRGYFKFQNITSAVRKEIMDYLVKHKATLTVYETEGSWDIAFAYMCKNFHEYYAYKLELKKKYRTYIAEENFSVFTEFVHYNRNYLVDEKHRDMTTKISFGAEKMALDAENVKLLHLISDNARVSLLELAKKLDVSSMAVKYRIKQLEKKKVILGYRAMVNYAKLGYEYYKVDIELEDLNKLSAFREFGRAHPNMTYEDRVAGGSDFECDFELKNYDEFFAIMDELRDLFPGAVRSFKYYKARRIYKYVYMPEE